MHTYMLTSFVFQLVLTVLLNVAGAAVAMAAVVLYSVYLAGISPEWGCDYDYDPYNGYWYDQHTPKTPTVEEKLIREKCWEAQAVLGVSLRRREGRGSAKKSSDMKRCLCPLRCS